MHAVVGRKTIILRERVIQLGHLHKDPGAARSIFELPCAQPVSGRTLGCPPGSSAVKLVTPDLYSATAATETQAAPCQALSLIHI